MRLLVDTHLCSGRWRRAASCRLLVAQALSEPAMLLTNDAQLGRYDAQIRVV